MEKTGIVHFQHNSLQNGQPHGHEWQGEGSPGPSEVFTDEIDEEKTATFKDVMWQPFWLRQSILFSFFCLFVCLTVALSLLVFFSERNTGLIDTSDSLAYLWRFLPTAIFTLISILWLRVELQSLRYMPWIARRAGQSLKDSGTDYSHMLLPMVLLQSLRHRDIFVFVIVIVSMIMKIQIILSAGLLQIEATQLQVPADIRVLDSFETTKNLSDTIDNSLYYNALNIKDFDMALPFGIAPGFAYQTFEPRGTIDAPVTVEVDGFFMNVTCQTFTNFNVTWQKFGDYLVLMEYGFEDCGGTVTGRLSGGNGWVAHWDHSGIGRPCVTLPQQHEQFLHCGALFDPSSESEPVVDLSAAVVCSPSSWLAKVEVVDNGVTPRATVSPVSSSEPAILVNSDPWSILKHSIPSSIPIFYPGPVVDGYMDTLSATAFGFNGSARHVSDRSIYDSEALEQAILGLASHFGPVIGHYMLRRTQPTTVTGLEAREIKRLFISQEVGLSIMVLFALSAIITLWAAVKSQRTAKVWKRDPATILGAMANFYDDSKPSGDMAEFQATRGRSKVQWHQGNYSPLVLQSWVRLLFCLFTMSIIAILAGTLRTSQSSRGFIISSGPGSSISILWTLLPVLVLLGIAQYTGMVDSAIRDLAAFSLLLSRPCSAVELDVSFIDTIGLRALHHSVRLGVPAVTLSQTLATLCAVLTALGAIMFTVEPVDDVTGLEFQQQSWFGCSSAPEANEEDRTTHQFTRSRMQSLLIMRESSNFTFPPDTHADLLFPTLDTEDTDWEDGVSIMAKLPAAKLVPDCIKVPEDSYEIELKEEGGYKFATFKLPVTCPNGTNSLQHPWESLGVRLADIDNDPELFGVSLVAAENPSAIDDYCHLGANKTQLANVPWRMDTYAWGEFDYDSMSFNYFSAWQCNYSWAEVMTETNFVPAEDGGRLVIDPNNPPILTSDDDSPWTPSFAVPIYDLDIHMNIDASVFPEVDYEAGAPLSRQFLSILEPLGSISTSDLVGAGHDDEIIEALTSKVAIGLVQLANAENRLGLNETSLVSPSQHGELPPIEATITMRRYEVLQNPIVTFIIIGILSLVMLVNLWAMLSQHLSRLLRGRRDWLIDMSLQGLAPEGFSSINMMQSLLQGSNLVNCMPDNASLMRPDELYRHLANSRFRMGWFEGDALKGRVYTIGELDDEEFRFVGRRWEA